jgi:hypothetical protein
MQRVRSVHARVGAALRRLPPAVWLTAATAGYVLLWLARPSGPLNHVTPIAVYWLQGLFFVVSTSEHLSDEGHGMERGTLAWGLALLAACLGIEAAAIADHRFFSLPRAVPESEAGAYLLLAADTLYFALVLPWAAGRGAGILLDWLLPLDTRASEDKTEET